MGRPGAIEPKWKAKLLLLSVKYSTLISEESPQRVRIGPEWGLSG